MTKILPALARLIDSALADGVPCLVGTASKDGRPNISVKGSVLVLDEKNLAYWERSHRNALQNLGDNPHVVVWYRNAAKADQLPRGAAVRFHGTATIHTSGPLRDKVWDRTVPIERERDPEKKGVAVVIAVDKAEDLTSTPLPE
jgi:predicted pyridoxine 5'-phosphate oxidase superfamily flavin-nucleotide-binding protein